MKRRTMRSLHGRWRHGKSDHLIWECECHDCRKRRKYGFVKTRRPHEEEAKDADL